jgi:hypothetical protein
MFRVNIIDNRRKKRTHIANSGNCYWESTLEKYVYSILTNYTVDMRKGIYVSRKLIAAQKQGVKKQIR